MGLHHRMPRDVTRFLFAMLFLGLLFGLWLICR
jgi:hypothetical protein